MAYLPLILLVSAALFSGATVLSIVIAIRARREHRNTIFPVVREMEGLKTRRAIIASVIFLILTALTIGGWMATQKNPANILMAKEATLQTQTPQQILEVNSEPNNETGPVTESNAEQEEIDPTGSSDNPSNAPQIVGSTVIVTPDPTAPPTPSPQPEPTSSPTAAPTPSRKISSLPAPEGSSLGPITFGAEITEQQEALNPTEIFSIETEAIYAVFPYRGMKNGLPFTTIWYYQDKELAREEFDWSWGYSGRSFVFIKPRNPGTYKVELKIGDEIKASGVFEVMP
jgi:hypothetical protein